VAASTLGRSQYLLRLSRCCFASVCLAAYTAAEESDVVAAERPAAAATAQEVRVLGMTICRGTNVSVILPEDGMAEIENPFLAPADE
jgi:hypothetical protein